MSLQSAEYPAPFTDPLDAMITAQTQAPTEWSAPQMFDLKSDLDRASLKSKFANGQVQKVSDNLDEIADELFEWEHPSEKENDGLRATFVEDITSEGHAYGKWALFPWSRELVHYPGKEEHRNLRTSRNRNLITTEEQQQLYDANVAVFGLSVGSNVVEKLVSTGIGGKIIMGDPDRLSPSNLNRINGRFADVGAKKVHLMAQKVSEIDPYLEQVHFEQGFTPEGMGMLAAQRPHILFDEVDDLVAKVAMRKFAQQEGIPLVMATDLGDISMIDVERHDLGARPFHGRLKPREVERIHEGSLSANEKGAFTLKIVGVRHVTTRMLSSVMEVGRSIPGLPQLGVTASMGGALASIAAREIILGRDLPSGRYVCSLKKILDLSSPSSFSETLKTAKAFITSHHEGE